MWATARWTNCSNAVLSSNFNTCLMSMIVHVTHSCAAQHLHAKVSSSKLSCTVFIFCWEGLTASCNYVAFLQGVHTNAQLKGSTLALRDSTFSCSNLNEQTAVWNRPETPRSVTEATDIQTTVTDNQQQFLYIHSPGVTATSQLTRSFCYCCSRSVSLHSCVCFWLDFKLNCTTSSTCPCAAHTGDVTDCLTLSLLSSV